MNKLKSFTYFFIALLIAISSVAVSESQAAKRSKGKAKTTQTTSRKSNSKKKKNTSNSKKKRTSTKNRKKNTKKKSAKKSTSKRNVYTPPAPEQPSYDSLTLFINSAVLEWIPENMNPGGLRVNSVKPDSIRKIANIGLNENFTYLPVTRQMIDSLSNHIALILPDSLADYRINLNVGQKNLSYYITKVDKLPHQFRKNIPFVVEENPFIHPDKGMEGDIVALWHSHGRYYRPQGGGWLWQRPLFFETAEDVFTMGYILPYVVPMLENAGAYVMLPRERDTNFHEVIVDNDTNDEGPVYSQPYYKEMNGLKKWSTGEMDGFIYDLPDFRDTENPFENGTYRQVETVKQGANPSAAAWYADIPEDGEYAVYVSYKTLEDSPSDARYTVNYSGGSKNYRVNQTMGGGTWIYLGTFPLKKGYSDTTPIVTLSNISSEEGKTLTADAVKIGGGMGNIARSDKRSDIYYDPSVPECEIGQASDNNVSEEEEEEIEEEEEAEEEETTTEKKETTKVTNLESKTDDTKEIPAPQEKVKGPAPVFRTSGMPRFVEGARYWLHWAGFPEYIYSPYHGTDDYKDDYTSRGHWVNYLAGGSRVLPNQEGLNIPVDVAMALHSDAGKKADDGIVGTLGIYFTQNGISYTDGTPRINSRMLTDILMRQITNDVRKQMESEWTRRSMWDKSYVEARVPEVPTTLIELLSHQNYADMLYGQEPEFRFIVGRAIYKGIARFIAERKDRKLVIQPLPVKDFSISRIDKGHFRLEWKSVEDPLEPTATPSKYIILERSGDQLGFHRIGETKHTSYNVKCNDNEIHSFRVIAANEGGVSFPSETLAFREAEDDSSPVLIVNGFTRVSAPVHFSSEGRAGFDSETDFGVPYMKDISFTGHQSEFRRSIGFDFGKSNSNYATEVIAGNTFDYPFIHGKAMAAAGKGFVSASAGAVENGNIKLSDYHIVDLILGKQKSSLIAKGKTGVKYSHFSSAMKKALTDYNKKGGSLIVSGQYVASDGVSQEFNCGDSVFVADILGVKSSAGEKTRSGRVRTKEALTKRVLTVPYSADLNRKMYIVENPDILSPAPGHESEVILEFSDTEAPAGILTKKGESRNAVISVPLETITDESLRNTLMKDILDRLRK